MSKAPVSASQSGETPHYHGHRERLRDRFMSAGAEALADYEMLELILFRAIPRRDVKPLAKALLARFGGFADVVAARPERLKEVEGLGEAAIAEIKIVQAAAQRFAQSTMKSTLEKRQSLTSFAAVLDYCRTAMAFLEREEFRILFLDKKNALIADEVQSAGTVDHAPVYPREVMRRALELNATAMILVHNHPSGDPSPSGPDIQLTKEIVALGKSLNVMVHDHLIIGRDGFTSFKSLQLI